MKLEPANIVCPACGNANYMRHLIGKNVGHLNLKCINCNSYFNFDELYKRRIGEALKPKPLTNADRIRAMTDEELAERLACGLMPEEVRSGMNNGAFETHADALLWWLKQEAKE
jgi:hypothetical protein